MFGRRHAYQSIIQESNPACFFLALCGSVFAQTLSLSVDDAVRLALENNSSVQRERLAESVARARSAASWNAFLPDISLSAALRNGMNWPDWTILRDRIRRGPI